MAIRSLHIPLVFLLASSAGACSSADVGDEARASTDPETSTAFDTGRQVTPPGPEASGYALSGRLLLDATKGDRADLELATYGEDGAELCREPLVAELLVAEPPPAEPVLAWWGVSLDTRTSQCGVDSDLFLHLGIGAWDDRLDVPLAQQGLDGATAFGLYVQQDDPGPVWVLGIAGTAPQIAGDEVADALVPLADGTYDVTSLVQAPWPSR